MKVKEVIEALQKLDQEKDAFLQYEFSGDREVVFVCEEEGVVWLCGDDSQWYEWSQMDKNG